MGLIPRFPSPAAAVACLFSAYFLRLLFCFVLDLLSRLREISVVQPLQARRSAARALTPPMLQYVPHGALSFKLALADIAIAESIVVMNLLVIAAEQRGIRCTCTV